MPKEVQEVRAQLVNKWDNGDAEERNSMIDIANGVTCQDMLIEGFEILKEAHTSDIIINGVYEYLVEMYPKEYKAYCKLSNLDREVFCGCVSSMLHSLTSRDPLRQLQQLLEQMGDITQMFPPDESEPERFEPYKEYDPDNPDDE